jgi:hypothetical protein
MAYLSKAQYVLRKSVQHPGAGNTITHEIDKGGFVEDILVVARGVVTVSAGSATGTATGLYNPEGIVQQFEVIANPAAGSPYPGGTLKRVFPRSVKARQLFDSGMLLDLGATAIDGTAKSTTITSVPYLLRFSLPRLWSQNETSLYTNAYAGLQLVITMNTGPALFTGNDRTWDFSQVTFDIYDRRTYASPNGQDVAVLYEQDQIVPINGANDTWNLRDYLLKNEPFLDCLIFAETTSAFNLSDAILNQVKLVEDQNSVPFFRMLKPAAIKFRQSQKVKYAAASQVGMYLLEMAEDGMLTQLISCPAITLDVSNPGGANQDRLILSQRRIRLPGTFMPAKTA